MQVGIAVHGTLGPVDEDGHQPLVSSDTPTKCALAAVAPGVFPFNTQDIAIGN